MATFMSKTCVTLSQRHLRIKSPTMTNRFFRHTVSEPNKNTKYRGILQNTARNFASYRPRKPNKVHHLSDNTGITSTLGVHATVTDSTIHSVKSKREQRHSSKHEQEDDVFSNQDFGEEATSSEVERAKRVFNLPVDFYCEHLKERDKRYGPILQAAKSRISRETHGLILLEGHRLIADAIHAGAIVKYVYFNRYEDLESLPIGKISAEFFKMRYHHLKIWSAVQTPPSVMAICKIPELEDPLYEAKALPLTLVCDNIRDPGNMGTLLRSAAAAGCRQVITTKGCVDVWEPKVLRSGAGAHFQIPIQKSVTWESIQNHISDKPFVFMADHMGSKETAPHIEESEEELYRDTIEVIETEGGEKIVNYDYEEGSAEQYRNMPFTSHAYFDAIFSNPDGETVLIIGGETEGLSGSACRFAHDNYGSKVHIPMMQSVDSLNSAIAGSVILFEIKRQLLKCQ